MKRGELKVGESYPSAVKAFEYDKSLGLEKLFIYQESFSSCAIEGNRLTEVCSETLHRVLSGLLVSDRYLLGLDWTLKDMENKK